MGETLRAYLQRYTEDEIERIIQNPVKVIEFCKILIEHSWAPEIASKKETAYENLRKTLQNT